MIKAENLLKGQRLLIDLNRVKDRLPKDLLMKISKDPSGIWWGGYKMVDGNCFGLIIELADGSKPWFFEEELSEGPPSPPIK